ncbi:hypothetical protein SCP_0107950 [Sparassis crispa]|uniref:Uncharacterized protein n=1 Tax=Sparassis crispa TaxID=139825 RepID=A0A401G6X8_9APHY|nr:hypothetical protein SCP_0107950 [Sparassis crispa]GBE77913.1 hypothetical protein SCP_0107950 [Sparassis crispa]
MSPTPLSPNVVHILLQYIAPPSGLSHPLPPYLVSRALLQRHNFLHLTPDCPQEYLCWPSSPENQALAVDHLESLPHPVHDDESVTYPVQYTSDGESTYAHVDLTSPSDAVGARLVFQWDDTDGWKYHNTHLMPFPPGSRPALHDVLVPTPPTQDALPALTHQVTNHLDHSVGAQGHDDDSGDDDYWNTYGSHDRDSPSSRFASSSSDKDHGGSEDAYWAQYANVHGTADSTEPSPLPQPHRKPHLEHNRPDLDTHSPHPLPVPVRSHDSHEDALPIPPLMFPRPRHHSKYEPASPHALAHLLESIPPRESPSLGSGAAATIETESAILFGSDVPSPTLGGSTGSDESNTPSLPALPSALKLNGVFHRLSFLSEQVDASSNGDAALDEEQADPEDALRDSVQGIWKLWKAGRQGRLASTSPGPEGDREMFLRIVRGVVENT